MKVARSSIAFAMLLVAGLAPAIAAPPEGAARGKDDGVFVVKPYLQLGRKPSPTSLQLLWHAPDADADWAVEYRTGTGRAWTKAERPTSRRVAVAGVEPHRVLSAALTGLEPGGSFPYRVLKGGRPFSRPRPARRSRRARSTAARSSATAGRAPASRRPWPSARSSRGPTSS